MIELRTPQVAPPELTDYAGAERPLIGHLAQLAWIEEAANVCLIGPPGTCKTHLATALAIKACQAGHRTLFATAQQWVDRLEQAQHRNSLDDELRRLDRYRLLVIDEIGYLPLERQAANLRFALIARRYERALMTTGAALAGFAGSHPPTGSTFDS